MKKSFPGILLIIGSILITAIAWVANPQTTIYAGAGIALTTLALTFMLASRSAILEKLFHGIENMYFYHKVLAVFSIIFLIFHQYAMGISGSSLAGIIGEAAIMLFLAVIAVAFIGSKLKYETWRFVHRFVYLAYLLGLAHAYMLSPVSLFSPSLLSLVVGLYAILGIASGFYIIFLYQTIGFKYKGRIKKITHVNADTTELEILLNKDFDYEFGQFAFIKILQEGFEKAPHPFSISGGQGRTIFFTIKSSGDHTSHIYKDLKEGSSVSVDRAYGHMILKEGQDKQIWIAGGIGITPFISYIRETPVLDKEVDFYYAYTGQENAVYLDMLQAYAAQNPNLTLHLVDSKVSGFLDFSDYPLQSDTTVFMCGPLGMMNNFAKSFRENNPKADLVYEGFSFK
ncbi:ferredoxin reductase family protein [Streptococcus loxodontisalivarius]|uniref:Ferric reductase n=1 Tax=Streptococcus loxodontisalivarius TaxID=1349415 RepID=A0ABS2PUM4_9STRE|nr:ferric reductase-like transmembrane domain-containing protein [Streptococcus loxodontisalivarius]MBM7643715.1 putative ferric reductase [Streptococcus loxodontisalivarius]